MSFHQNSAGYIPVSCVPLSFQKKINYDQCTCLPKNNSQMKSLYTPVGCADIDLIAEIVVRKNALNFFSNAGAYSSQTIQ